MSIKVEGVYVPGKSRYVVEWKENQESWEQVSIYDTYSNGDLVTGDVSVIISEHKGAGLKGWKRYDVRAKVVTLDGKDGPYSEVKTIYTSTNFEFDAERDWLNVRKEIWMSFVTDVYADLNLNNIIVPNGTIEYSLVGYIIQTRCYLDPAGNPTGKTDQQGFAFNKTLLGNIINNILIEEMLTYHHETSLRWETSNVDIILTVIVKNEYGDTHTLNPISITAPKAPSWDYGL